MPEQPTDTAQIHEQAQEHQRALMNMERLCNDPWMVEEYADIKLSDPVPAPLKERNRHARSQFENFLLAHRDVLAQRPEWDDYYAEIDERAEQQRIEQQRAEQAAILPVPCDLYQELGELQDQAYQLHRRLLDVERSYLKLFHSPDALDVDNLGEPTSAHQKVTDVLDTIGASRHRLFDSASEIGRAHSHASRLKLTEQAAEEREQRVAAMWPEFTHSGPTEQAAEDQERVLTHRRSSGRERSR
ncbi:hypothetical protein [Nocardia sp. NPDC051750]|uniref:hypothetical protein n=1 Tax=Nocardia sp. NPDC051750 TaxID=3364325 RepID=UPI0037BD1BE1